MGRITVKQEVAVEEIDGEDTTTDRSCTLGVGSHSSIRAWVVLEIEGTTYTVEGQDLKVAIGNAMNCEG